MKKESENCKICGSKYVVNKTHCLCYTCNYKRLHNGKHPFADKNPNKPKKAVKIKTTGEKKMFLEIWNERPHVCENCKANLGNDARAHYFAHIKPKGMNPELRLVKSNIMLLCFECHYAHDFRGTEAFKNRTNE